MRWDDISPDVIDLHRFVQNVNGAGGSWVNDQCPHVLHDVPAQELHPPPLRAAAFPAIS